MQKKKYERLTPMQKNLDVIRNSKVSVENLFKSIVQPYIKETYNEMNNQNKKVSFYTIMFSLLTEKNYDNFLKVLDEHCLPTQNELTSQNNVDLKVIHKYLNSKDTDELYLLLSFDKSFTHNLRLFNGDILELRVRVQDHAQNVFQSIILELDKDSLVIYQDLRKLNLIGYRVEIKFLLEKQEKLKNQQLKEDQDNNNNFC